MGCGCAGRARKGLAFLGYELIDGSWIDNKTGDIVPDVEIEKHHTRIAAEVLARQARARASDARAFAARVFGSADNGPARTYVLAGMLTMITPEGAIGFNQQTRCFQVAIPEPIEEENGESDEQEDE